MRTIKVVIDTNVILSGLLSQKGASYRLLQLIPKKLFTVVISVPLTFEYETILLKNIRKINLLRRDIDDFLNYICAISEHTNIYYLWRPILKDPYDDHILELAVSSNAKYIVTFNTTDFTEANKFGIFAIEPEEFIGKIRG